MENQDEKQDAKRDKTESDDGSNLSISIGNVILSKMQRVTKTPILVLENCKVTIQKEKKNYLIMVVIESYLLLLILYRRNTEKAREC